MTRFGLTLWGIICVAAVSFLICGQRGAFGYYLDKGSTMKFGLRAYVNARIGLERTDKEIVTDPGDKLNDPRDDVRTFESMTWPESPAGHLRQNRFFIEAELDHNITGLMRKGFGPLAILNHLPFKVRKLKYHLTYRGEGEGIYDWGPSEFRSSSSPPYRELLANAGGVINPPSSCESFETCVNIPGIRDTIRENAVSRHRLFQAYVDLTIGDLFIRAGRQILVWGETDAFRLMDRINPVDSSFGGFLIPLDERRVPLDMIRASYYLGQLGARVSEAVLEGFASIDDEVSFFPGTLDGTPWELPNNGIPRGIQEDRFTLPARTFKNIRGGVRFMFTTAFSEEFDVTWSLAHYYTFDDIPSVQTYINPGDGSSAFSGFPFNKRLSENDTADAKIRDRLPPGTPLSNLPSAQPPVCRDAGGDKKFGTPDDQPPGCRLVGQFSILAPFSITMQRPVKIAVSGATATFTVPAQLSRRLGLSGEPVIRAELAYLKDQPYHTQYSLDPFTFHSFNLPPADAPATGGVLQRDSINFVLGIDTNQFIRFLNPGNSFFITTQFFYKHIKGHTGAPDVNGAVLPVRAWSQQVRDLSKTDDKGEHPVIGALKSFGAVQPVLVTTDENQFLHTLLIATSYRSGTVNPSFTFFYDWSGARAYIPAVTFIHDPFRFTLEADILEASSLKGNSGVSLLRDRDNIMFQIEYVI